MSASLHIGFDDTDSPGRGCTTYIAALLVEKLSEMGCRFLDYPNLVRLNPNIPWKTRGNGAVCLRITCPREKRRQVEDTAIQVVQDNSELSYEATDPAIAILEGEIQQDLRVFSELVLTDIATVEQALSLANKHGMRYEQLKGRRGIVGAVAAIGSTLTGDHTYELITYRSSKKRSKNRAVDPDSVHAMDAATKPFTFNNIDEETKRILITPRGNDPVLYGIRGETPLGVLEAHRMISVYEDVERWVIFRTNHGTDSHLRSMEDLSHARPHCPIIATGTVFERPRTIPGGHVIFRISDNKAMIDCAAYEPTGNFRWVVSKLIPGDAVEVFGGVRPASNSYGLTVNLEKIRIMKLAVKVQYENPLCPQCETRMESEGRFQGFRCRRCGIEDLYVAKRKVIQDRRLRVGLHLPPARAHRHLTKPLSRYGREKRGFRLQPINEWSWPRGASLGT